MVIIYIVVDTNPLLLAVNSIGKRVKVAMGVQWLQKSFLEWIYLHFSYPCGRSLETMNCSLAQLLILSLLLVSFQAQIMEKLKRGHRIFTVNGCRYRGVVVHFRSSDRFSDVEAIHGVPYKKTEYFSEHNPLPRINKTTICHSSSVLIKEATNFDFVCMQTGTGNIGVVKDAKKRFYENLVYRLVFKREECYNLNLYVPYQGK